MCEGCSEAKRENKETKPLYRERERERVLDKLNYMMAVMSWNM